MSCIKHQEITLYLRTNFNAEKFKRGQKATRFFLTLSPLAIRRIFKLSKYEFKIASITQFSFNCSFVILKKRIRIEKIFLFPVISNSIFVPCSKVFNAKILKTISKHRYLKQIQIQPTIDYLQKILFSFLNVQDMSKYFTLHTTEDNHYARIRLGILKHGDVLRETANNVLIEQLPKKKRIKKRQCRKNKSNGLQQNWESGPLFHKMMEENKKLKNGEIDENEFMDFRKRNYIIFKSDSDLVKSQIKCFYDEKSPEFTVQQEMEINYTGMKTENRFIEEF